MKVHLTLLEVEVGSSVKHALVKLGNLVQPF